MGSLGGHRAAVSVDVYILVPSTVVRRKRKKMLLEESQCRRKKCFCAKLVTFGFFKIKVPMLTNVKQTQLSNPQKCQSDFIKKGKK